MMWHLFIGTLAILVLAVAIVQLIRALLRRRLAPADERAPPARSDSSASNSAASETSPSSPSSRPPEQALQPHRSNVPIPRQPGDALLVKLRQATHRTLDERYAMRHRGKLHSPVDPDDADSLRALRIETELCQRPRPAQQAGAQAPKSI
jgi:hypothetical protein